MDVVSSIVSAVQLIIANAPKIEQAIVVVKDFITGLFGAGVIDAPTQAALHAHVDALADAFLNGKVPPEFTVEKDPGT